jgi:hypothetical protein
MKAILCLALSFVITRTVCARTQIDTCIYTPADKRSLQISEIVNLDTLIALNKNKDFYVAMITVSTGFERSTVIQECSSIDKGKVITFNDSVARLDFNQITIDSLTLFSMVPDSTMITFEASRCGIGFHNPLSILIFKLKNKLIVGYSIDGSDLITFVKRSLTTRSPSESERLFVILDMLSIKPITGRKSKRKRRAA